MWKPFFKIKKHRLPEISMSFQEKYWYIFPAQVFRFLEREREEIRLYHAALSLPERREIKRDRFRLLLSFFVSLCAHSAFLFVILNNYFMDAVMLGEKKASGSSEVDFNLMEGMISSHLDPVYDINSNLVVKPSSLIKKREKQLFDLENLLKKLKSKTALQASGAVVDAAGGKKERFQTRTEELNLKERLRRRIKRRSKIPPIAQIQLWNRVQMAQTTEDKKPAAANYSKIMKTIDSHNFQFQECYEAALLKDETLSGKIIFLLKLQHSKVKKTNLKLEGGGNSSSRRTLLRCLYRESKKLVFPQNRENISIKFSLIFGL